MSEYHPYPDTPKIALPPCEHGLGYDYDLPAAWVLNPNDPVSPPFEWGGNIAQIYAYMISAAITSVGVGYWGQVGPLGQEPGAPMWQAVLRVTPDVVDPNVWDHEEVTWQHALYSDPVIIAGFGVQTLLGQYDVDDCYGLHFLFPAQKPGNFGNTHWCSWLPVSGAYARKTALMFWAEEGSYGSWYGVPSPIDGLGGGQLSFYPNTTPPVLFEDPENYPGGGYVPRAIFAELTYELQQVWMGTQTTGEAKPPLFVPMLPLLLPIFMLMMNGGAYRRKM